jgi:eukaryotic-like serine/threonine-protein kinase
MSAKPDHVKTIFGKALEFSSLDARSDYLDHACAEDPALRGEINELLAAMDKAGDFLVARTGDASPSTDFSGPERPGIAIGPYKLLQQIGEGGMGVVFMAEQSEPVRRKVALKIIKPGMDSRQVIARFEAER